MIDPAIQRAEELIARSRKLQPSTRKMREQFMARIRQGKGPARPFKSIGYWRNYVAAVQLEVARFCEPFIERAQNGDQEALRKISQGLAILDNLEQSRPAVNERKARQGRMKALSRLRAGWQERIYEQLSEKWRPVFAALALTGCRPAELNGLEIYPQAQEGILKFRIWGKKVSDKAGQEWRELTIDVSSSSYGLALLRDFETEPGYFEIEETDDAIRKAITRAARRAKIIRLDQTVPPYACRNAVASGMKAEGFDIIEISGALGHSTDECQKYYGRARAGHKSGGGRILDVKTARPVRRSNRAPTPLPNLAKKNP